MISPARACTARDNHSRVKKKEPAGNLKALIRVGLSGLMVAGRIHATQPIEHTHQVFSISPSTEPQGSSD